MIACSTSQLNQIVTKMLASFARILAFRPQISKSQSPNLHDAQKNKPPFHFVLNAKIKQMPFKCLTIPPTPKKPRQTTRLPIKYYPIPPNLSKSPLLTSPYPTLPKLSPVPHPSHSLPLSRPATAPAILKIFLSDAITRLLSVCWSGRVETTLVSW